MPEPSTDRELRQRAAAVIDWLLKEYVNAYSGISVVWDQEVYDSACVVRERLEEYPSA